MLLGEDDNRGFPPQNILPAVTLPHYRKLTKACPLQACTQAPSD